MSRVKNIDVPITKVACKTTREMLYPSKDKLRQLYRSTFETTKDHDNQHYLTNHILTITSNQTDNHLMRKSQETIFVM